MRLSDRRSIFAIDPTPRGIAFVFFEDGRLLDWGERLRRSEDEFGIAQTLVDGCAADILVLEDPDASGSRRHPRIRKMLREIVKRARRRGVTVIPVSRAEVLCSWLAQGATNKAAIAAEIASRYEELAAVIPPCRGAGASEDPRMHIFDAASLAIHYDETRRKRIAR